MNLQQLRYAHEVAKRGLNITEAAAALYTSQPGISKQIRLLEEELGVDIFVRQGRRLTDITAPGRQILDIIEDVLGGLANLKQVGEEYSQADSGTLTIATTHTQARYALPPVIRAFMARYPGVRLELHQGNPTQICDWVIAGKADLAIATEAIAEQHELVMLPCQQWNRCVIAPPGHPILEERPLTLEAIARYPVVTYDSAFSGRSQINKAFAARDLSPNVVLTAIDADIIKTYVSLGLGIGIVAAMAYDASADTGLRAVDASHLFESSMTRIGIRRNAWLREYAYVFIELFAPHLARPLVQAALQGDSRVDPGL
ncbi:DNA-binding transcriptional dual regulator, O-acetyl-L-serine-binding [Sterolibacterium denitrificans]|uniref:DNA-binding transcriptional dual regulator, O-acetyl-L-serine-binding n=1 Tax=Sterolibacterium denitrificans TaxID=157592 RepID=A0A7Z7HQL4_9PROT|nr:HTH-type transcriptional regulator CysB [Sterolibacterium denitrificans]SMB23756.1 DNA-binding transcriptional dual regulator, O-acetyl-L-serine-binding [Sterolibacterium denitrificans]